MRQALLLIRQSGAPTFPVPFTVPSPQNLMIAAGTTRIISTYSGACFQGRANGVTSDINFDANGVQDAAQIASFSASNSNAAVEVWGIYNQVNGYLCESKDSSGTKNNPLLAYSGGSIITYPNSSRPAWKDDVDRNYNSYWVDTADVKPLPGFGLMVCVGYLYGSWGQYARYADQNYDNGAVLSRNNNDQNFATLYNASYNANGAAISGTLINNGGQILFGGRRADGKVYSRVHAGTKVVSSSATSAPTRSNSAFGFFGALLSAAGSQIGKRSFSTFLYYKTDTESELDNIYTALQGYFNFT